MSPETPRAARRGCSQPRSCSRSSGCLCARDALSFLFFWELMTLVPAAIILVGTATESARHAVFTYVAITHLGGAGTWIALLLLAHEGAIGNSCCAQRRLGCSGGDRGRRDHRLRHEGRPHADARMASPSTPDRSGVHLGPDERRHGRRRRVRPRPRARRLARPRPLLDRRHGARPRWAVGARRDHVCALPARAQAPARVLDGRAPRHRRARDRRLPAAAPRTARTSGPRSRSAPRSSTPSTTRRSRHCCSSAPACSSVQPAPSSSIASEGSCAGCRGAAAPSSSVRSRLRGCRCSTASHPNG